jgi:predicted RNase H-like nuclease (RuvC/YqgF family)
LIFCFIVQTDEIEKLKQTVNILQTKPSSISDTIQQIDDDKTNINYKTKWEESEAKCHQLEKKCRQLETGTIKQLQDKITQLERENNQIKVRF